MFSTDNLFFLVLFIVPGAILLLFNKYIKPIPTTENDETVRLMGALFFSFIIFGVNSMVFSDYYTRFSTQKSVFDDSCLLLEIIIFNILVSFLACILWSAAKRWVTPHINNCISFIMKRPKVTRFNSVWVSILEDKVLGEITSKNVARIEKDGMSSVGFVRMWSPPASDNIEIVLERNTDIQEYFDNDELFENKSDRIFSDIDYEYIDLSNGFKITIYNMDKYNAYISQPHENENAE